MKRIIIVYLRPCHIHVVFAHQITIVACPHAVIAARLSVVTTVSIKSARLVRLTKDRLDMRIVHCAQTTHRTLCVSWGIPRHAADATQRGLLKKDFVDFHFGQILYLKRVVSSPSGD
jgi:hypothetical protein